MSAGTSPNPTSDCAHHPGIPAQFVCARCQSPVCINCCYTMPDDTITCKNCLEAVPGVVPPPIAPPQEESAPRKRVKLSLRMSEPEPTVNDLPQVTQLPPGQGCVQHPNVIPAAFCKNCGARSCRVCNFSFPGNLNLCPVCAATAHATFSPRRKKYLITAFVMAGWSTFITVALVAIAVGMVDDPIIARLLDIVVTLIVVVSAAIGTAMAMSAMRKGANSVGIWIALMWNSLIFGGVMLLSIIGHLMEIFGGSVPE